MASKTIHVILRFDDPSAVSPADLEAAIVAALRRRGMSVTFGVVPFVCAGDIADPSPQPLLPLPEDKIALLRRAAADETIEVALHGYSHQARAAGVRSEFAGLPADEQRRRLALGKAALEEAGLGPVRTFIPPWNAYDEGTLGALEALGFEALSADWKGVATPETRLRFVPATADLARLPQAVEEARSSPDPDPVVVVLFHPYDFASVDPARGRWSLETFAALLDRLAARPDVRVNSIAGALARVPDLGAERFRAAAAWRAVQAATPPLLRHRGPVLAYPETGAHRRALRRLSVLYAGFVLAAATAMGAGWVAVTAAGGLRAAAATICALALAATAYGVLGLGLSPGAFRAARAAGRALAPKLQKGAA
jgi:peptidoglycan/xylan/chitin deacetylase (PgdA/CDA1 family)